jgi:hypothetical protein
MTRRYEREILELVERKEREHRGRERVARARHNLHRARNRFSPLRLWEWLGSASWLSASLTVAVVAFALHNAVPDIAAGLALLAVLFFFLPVVYQPGKARNEARWRNQVINLPPRDGPFHAIRFRIWQIKHERRRQRGRNR